MKHVLSYMILHVTSLVFIKTCSSEMGRPSSRPFTSLTPLDPPEKPESTDLIVSI